MCGVFGIAGHPDAAAVVRLGLLALQHRGEESAGIVSSAGGRLHAVRNMGLVTEALPDTALAELPGELAIGHVRYSTTGGSLPVNAQPLAVDGDDPTAGEAEAEHGPSRAGAPGRDPIAVAHNGNLTNYPRLRRELEAAGATFRSDCDTEVLAHLVARGGGEPLAAVAEALARAEGAWSLALLWGDSLIAARDPHGFRPLVLGRLGRAWAVASEPCALDLVGATYARDLEPGEVVRLRAGAEPESRRPLAPAPPCACVFELIYFARADSHLGGRGVYAAREAMGRRLAAEQPAPADVVVPVPDSALPAAVGFARAAGVPLDIGLVRSHYVGRTFIGPEPARRPLGVRLKLGAVRSVVEGRRVAVVDDSLVRGTTARQIVDLLRGAGAREVHLRIASPPAVHPCYYGIDTPDPRELVAARLGAEEVGRHVECDTLGHLSLAGLLRAVDAPDGAGFCDACFSGRYPLEPPNGGPSGRDEWARAAGARPS